MKLVYKILMLLTTMCSFGILLSNYIDLHSCLLYLDTLCFGYLIIMAYYIGAINQKRVANKQLIKQCMYCNLFLPFKNGVTLEHYCPEKEKKEKENIQHPSSVQWPR